MTEIKSENNDRYQHQFWLVRLFRRRYYLAIPFKAVKYWYSEQTRDRRDEDDWRMSLSDCWGLATGLAQGKMKWYYNWDELNHDFSLKEDLTSDEE